MESRLGLDWEDNDLLGSTFGGKKTRNEILSNNKSSGIFCPRCRIRHQRGLILINDDMGGMFAIRNGKPKTVDFFRLHRFDPLHRLNRRGPNGIVRVEIAKR